MKSIICDTKKCYVCNYERYVEEHHVLFGKNRKKSEEDGLKVYLCYEHHRGTNGVHGKNGKDLDIYLKEIAEKRWIEYYGKTKEEFRERYGRNYL